MNTSDANPVVELPPPARDGSISLESAVCRRRSVREYSAAAITLPEASQLLWAAQGVTNPDGLRVTASAHALYPLDTYLLTGRVDGLPPGLYKYVPGRHELMTLSQEDEWTRLWTTILNDRAVKESAAVMAFTARYEPITDRYGPRGKRFVHMEVGHVVQNVYLQAAALSLATVVVGSFTDSDVAGILDCPESERPMVLMPVGRPA